MNLWLKDIILVKANGKCQRDRKGEIVPKSDIQYISNIDLKWCNIGYNGSRVVVENTDNWSNWLC